MFDIDFLDIPPLTSAHGHVYLPGSKSISNRVLLLAGLSEGYTEIHDVLASDDTQVMLQALRDLGCLVTAIGQRDWGIQGLGGQLKTRQASLFLGNAGTAMRPLAAALALMATTQGGCFELTGVPRMYERPIGDLVDALVGMGCVIHYQGKESYPPLQIGDHAVHALDWSQAIRVRGDVSSQFLTSLLLALPLVATQDIEIQVEGELISRPYIDITLRLLAQFGVHVRTSGSDRFTIVAGSHYQTPKQIYVEADASSASYFIALGAIACTAQDQHSITLHGIGRDSIQGDIRFIEAAQAMGADIQAHEHHVVVQKGAFPLQAIDLNCNAIPDAAMTLAMMALYAKGTTRLSDIASWRVKETDRLYAMATELRKLGAHVDEGPDFIEITPPLQWQSTSIHTYDDHRIAMCFSLAAFNPLRLPIRIQDPACVAKTFPDYFETFFSVVQTSQEHIPVLCVDGPSASGKGTLSQALAKALGYHWLDSGVLYRIAAWLIEQQGGGIERAISSGDQAVFQAWADQIAAMELRFEGDQIWVNQQEVSQNIRTEACSTAASRISALAAIRQALLVVQHRYRRLPGLVADGRDMGTVIFPEATLKVFLTATAEKRAQRRHKQLLAKGISVNIDSLLSDLVARDARDTQRAISPLVPAKDARLLDNSHLTIEQSVNQVLAWWSKRALGPVRCVEPSELSDESGV